MATKKTLSKEWHPTKNGQLTPSQVFLNTHKKVWWLGVCRHEWEASITNRTSRHSNCPFCSGKKVLCGYNDLITTHPFCAMNRTIERTWIYRQHKFPKVVTELYGGYVPNVNTIGGQQYTLAPAEKAALNVQEKNVRKKIDFFDVFTFY